MGLGINTGIVVSGLLGLLLPYEAAAAVRAADERWRIVYGISLVAQLYGLFIFGFVIKNPSLNELIKNDEKELAKREIKRFYAIDQDNEEAHLEELYTNIQKGLSEPSQGVSTCQALCGKKYRMATFNGIVTMFID